MYKVFCNNTLMCDSRIEELALINPVVNLEENKAGSFSFKILPAHPHYDSIQKRKTIVDVYLDDEKEPVFSGMCIEDKIDIYKQKEIYCEGDLAFLNDSIQRPKRYQGYSVRGLLEAYINNHNAQVEESKQFVVGVITVTDSNNYISCYTNMENTMKAIKEDLVDDLGGFIRTRHENGVRYIDYLADSPYTNTQTIKLGKNLVDFKSNIDTTDIATVIIPLGAKLEESAVEGLETRLTIESINDGLDYVHNVDAVAAYGWIYKTVTYDNVTTPEALKRKGDQYLTETQFENVYIEAKVVDLHLADKSIERLKMSDKIRVSSISHGLNKYFRLTKQTLNLNNPEKDKFTLGKNEKIRISTKSNEVSEQIRKTVESIVPPSSILSQAVANATALISSAMGGFVVKTNNELLIMDTNNIETATKVWRWNINGLGYSSNGYKGPYALAMTMDGKFVANAITVEGLEVGKNVKMGENATISWENVTEQPTIPSKTSQLTNDSSYTTMSAVENKGYQNASQVTQITKDTVTSAFIKALKLCVGDEIIMGENATISWENVTEQPTIPSKTSQLTNDSSYTTMSAVENKGYQNASQVTQITKDTVTTSFINALKVIAGSVAAENITGTTITGKKINGGSIEIGDGNFVVNTSGNVTAKRITATSIKSAGNVSFEAVDTENGGIYSNANIYAEKNITAEGNITSNGGIYSNTNIYAEQNITADGNITSTNGGLSIDKSASVGGNVTAKGNLDITGTATLRNGCSVKGAISSTNTISSGGGLNANGGGIYSSDDIYAEGTIATPSWSSASDKKMKQNIVDVEREEALCLLEEIKLRKYQFAADPDIQRIGFIAQEVQEVLANNNLDKTLFVQHIKNPHTEEEHLGLNYLDMCSVLWKGWQILNEEIKELKEEINILKGEK